VRYRTAAISCFALIGALFGYPELIWAFFLPSLKDGPSPLPAYDRFFLDIAVFCDNWRFILLLPALGLGLIFTIAELTASRAKPSRQRST
jgi:hypothetical protein